MVKRHVTTLTEKWQYFFFILYKLFIILGTVCVFRADCAKVFCPAGAEQTGPDRCETGTGLHRTVARPTPDRRETGQAGGQTDQI